jgi:hypothetical protein
MTFSKIAALASSSWPLGGTSLSGRKDVELLDQRKPRDAPALMDLDCWNKWTGSPKFGIARSQLPNPQRFEVYLDDDEAILPSCRITWLERCPSRRVCMRRSPEEIVVTPLHGNCQSQKRLALRSHVQFRNFLFCTISRSFVSTTPGFEIERDPGKEKNEGRLSA